MIEAAAERADWKPRRRRATARAAAALRFARYKNLAAYVAVVVEVEVDRATGAVRVPRAVTAVDAGQIVNPDGLINQIEGGIVQSASWTLHEQVRFDRRGVTSARLGQPTRSCACRKCPQVETVLIDRPDEPFLGAGEASQGPTAAAIANAFAHATGKRLRDLPFTPERVKAAFA